MENVDKYSRIESILKKQQEKKDKILEIFEKIFNTGLGLTEKIKINISFEKNDLIKVKILENSSIRFVVLKEKEKISEEFQRFFPDNTIKII